jgi:glycosyltransferase involved in cell wall biosynthesis
MAGQVSIILPTFNRRDILQKCLDALAKQTVSREEMEVIIVDDGSTDDSPRFARTFLERSFPRWILLEGENRGPAHARNRGLRAATAQLILLIGDDMIAAPDLVAEHLAWHLEHQEDRDAVLGLVEWLDRNQMHFGYRDLLHGEEVLFWHFCSSNVSFKRSFVISRPLFDTDFPFAAYEDTEFGHRLHKRGLRIRYNEKAVTYHLHPMTLESFCRRMDRAGEALTLLLAKAPELDRDGRIRRMVRPRLRHSLVHFAYPLLSRVFPPAGPRLQRRYFRARSHNAQWKGFRRGESKRLRRG